MNVQGFREFGIWFLFQFRIDHFQYTGHIVDAMKEKGLTLTYTDAVVDYLVEKSYSVTYGARNLRRLIQKEIEDVVAQKLIERRGEPTARIRLTAADGQLQVTLEGNDA